MRQRILTGLAAGLIFAALTVLGGWYYDGLLLLLALIGFHEYVRLNGIETRHPIALTGFAGMLVLSFPWESAGLAAPPAAPVIWCLMFALLAYNVLTKNRLTLDASALLLLGAVYVGVGFSAMMDVRAIEPHGLYWTALAFASIWSSDSGAYFAGRAFGRTKLWPSISPNKTVEGALGGVLAALAVAFLFSIAAPDRLSLGEAAGIGLIASVAGQFGDLIQSAYKRLRGVKDSGTLLPGHGGVLDRCDSWLIVFPLLVLSGLLP